MLKLKYTFLNKMCFHFSKHLKFQIKNKVHYFNSLCTSSTKKTAFKKATHRENLEQSLKEGKHKPNKHASPTYILYKKKKQSEKHAADGKVRNS